MEANSSSFSDLLTAVNTASHTAGVVAVSMSWGGSEFSGETADDSYFTTPAGHANEAFFVSSGDDGAPASYPSTSPNVVSVGGTSLYLNGTSYSSEAAWSGSGGGLSSYESQPSYQKGVVTQSTTARGNPDVSYDADPNTGFPVYDSYNNGTAKPWGQWGGTSDAAPQWAALVAIADEGRAINGLRAPLNGRQRNCFRQSINCPRAISTISPPARSTGSPSYAATVGYDLATGRGTPVANQLIAALSTWGGSQTVTAPAAPANFSAQAISSSQVSVVAWSLSNGATSYNLYSELGLESARSGRHARASHDFGNRRQLDRRRHLFVPNRRGELGRSRSFQLAGCYGAQQRPVGAGQLHRQSGFEHAGHAELVVFPGGHGYSSSLRPRRYWSCGVGGHVR